MSWENSEQRVNDTNPSRIKDLFWSTAIGMVLGHLGMMQLYEGSRIPKMERDAELTYARPANLNGDEFPDLVVVDQGGREHYFVGNRSGTYRPFEEERE